MRELFVTRFHVRSSVKLGMQMQGDPDLLLLRNVGVERTYLVKLDGKSIATMSVTHATH